MKLALILAVSVLISQAGCNTHPPAIQSTAGVPAPPQGADTIVRPAYVYVVDQAAHLIVLPAHASLVGTPIRTVDLPVPAISVASDSQGNVYVALWGASSIEVFSSGATKLLRVINLGAEHPYGIAVDDNDNLLVARDGKSGAGVSEYRPGAEKRFASFPIPEPYAVYSVAADHAGHVYAAVYASPYNFVEEFINGAWTRLQVTGAGPSAIAIDARGNLIVSAVHTVETYNAPTWSTRTLRNLEATAETKWTSRGADGNIYVPVTGPDPYVLVIPSISISAPWKISLPSNPNGATAGV
jgi:hypothetical protein